MIIELAFSPDQSRQINHLLTGRSFGEGQGWDFWDTVLGEPGGPQGENSIVGCGVVMGVGDRGARRIPNVKVPVRLPKKSVLVMDGSADSHSIIALALHHQYRLVQARTAREGLGLLRREPVDAVILEARLPDLSGLEVIRRLKRLRPRIPAIMVTAFGSEAVCAAAFKLGIRDYFAKPVDSASLVVSVRRILAAAGRTATRQNVLFERRALRTGRHASEPRSDQHVLVHRAVRFIDEHYSEPISLPSVAAACGAGKFALCRSFRCVMQVTFRDYLVRRRLEKARDLLTGHRYSVTEVAQMIGFGDLPRFDKVFKKHIGMPPSRYRRELTPVTQ